VTAFPGKSSSAACAAAVKNGTRRAFGPPPEKREEISLKAIRLAEAVSYAPGSVVSKTLVEKKAGTLTLFAFDAEQGLSEHTAPFDAVVEILEGEALLAIGGKQVPARAGELVIMPAGIPHAVVASGRFKMLLIMIRDTPRA
jgi:quercetin dioxygenase-like cupin family protein